MPVPCAQGNPTTRKAAMMARKATAGPDLDTGKLALAVRAVMACGRPGPDGTRVPVPQAQVAREAQVPASDLAQLLNHGARLTARDTLRVMTWLNLPPGYLMRDPAPPSPAPDPDPVAA